MGRCILDLVDAVDGHSDSGPVVEIVGVVDDGRPDADLLAARGVSHPGGIGLVEEMPAGVGYVIGIGDPESRRGIDRALRRSGRHSPVLVHPNVHRGFAVVLGPGAVICSHVSMENNIRLGRHVHINQNSVIGHDTVIGDYSTISPLAAVSGSVTMQSSVFLGTGATVNQGVTLHSQARVGAGAAVVADVPTRVTVVGVPARPMA